MLFIHTTTKYFSDLRILWEVDGVAWKRHCSFLLQRSQRMTLGDRLCKSSATHERLQFSSFLFHVYMKLLHHWSLLMAFKEIFLTKSAVCGCFTVEKRKLIEVYAVRYSLTYLPPSLPRAWLIMLFPRMQRSNFGMRVNFDCTYTFWWIRSSSKLFVPLLALACRGGSRILKMGAFRIGPLASGQTTDAHLAWEERLSPSQPCSQSQEGEV